MSYIPLHVQSHYSILQAVPTVDELITQAQQFQMPAMALTDLNNMFGVPDFGKAMKKAGLKPLFGLKLNLLDGSRFSRTKIRGEREQERRPKDTLLLLAQSDEGYQNLLKLVSAGYKDASFGRFHVDSHLLEEYSSGIIALSSDHTGLIQRFVRENDEKLNHYLSFFTELYGKERFFIEIQHNPDIESKITNKLLLEKASEYGLKTVASNTVRMIKSDDQILCDIVQSIAAGVILPAYADRPPSQQGDHFLAEDTSQNNLSVPLGREYFKSSNEMAEDFCDLPEALSNTFLVAEMCEDINFQAKGDQSPQYPIPQGHDTESFLRLQANKGLQEKFPNGISSEYQKRLDWELDTVCSMGFPNYFLVVGDFVGFARKNGIFVGPGRGSAAGALLSYVLGITNIDPLIYDLLFERFLNPERISMPDIDIDFEDDRRDEVKEYLRSAYGADRTADVITFGYNKAKAVLKDVGRVMNIPLKEIVEKATELISFADSNKALSVLIEEIPSLKELSQSPDKKKKNWISYSVRLCDRIRNLGKHASALIVAGRPLDHIIPLARDKSGTITTQFEGSYLEENGLLKMDILGLSNLGIIRECLQRIHSDRGEIINPDDIPLDDPTVYNLFSTGHTAGIFQFESDGMTAYLKDLKPTCIDDLIAMNALYRPGPMDNIPSFIARKNGQEPVDCFHPDLETILKPTYGVIVYQEQVMQIAQVLCGFSLGEADNVRRIMAKKKPEELNKIHAPWIEGAVKKGYSIELAQTLFDLLIPFSNYAFNKSHAASYSVLAYQTAWLKTHYCAEYMASLMAFNINATENINKYIQEARHLGIEVLPPDINKSGLGFSLEKDQDGTICIRYALNALKGFGDGAAEILVRERRWGGNYTSIEDFIERSFPLGIRKANFEILVSSGAFNSFFTEENILEEKSIYLNSGNINALYARHEKTNSESDNLSLFSTDELLAAASEILSRNVTIMSEEEEYAAELRVFGFSFSGQLFDKLFAKYGKYSTYKDSLRDILPLESFCSFIGHITKVEIMEGKRSQWARLIINTGQEQIFLSLFQDAFNRFQSLDLREKEFVFVKAYIKEYQRKDGTMGRSFNGANFIRMSQKQPLLSELNIVINSTTYSPELQEILQKIKEISTQDYYNKAHISIKFHLPDDEGFRQVSAGTDKKVFYTKELVELLDSPHIYSFWFT